MPVAAGFLSFATSRPLAKTSKRGLVQRPRRPLNRVLAGVVEGVAWSLTRPMVGIAHQLWTPRFVVAEQGFEPRPKAPKTRVLPLHHSAMWTLFSALVANRTRLAPGEKSGSIWCRRPDSNRHGSPQRFLRPPRLPFRHFGDLSRAGRTLEKSGAEDEARTRDLLLGKEALYH